MTELASFFDCSQCADEAWYRLRTSVVDAYVTLNAQPQTTFQGFVRAADERLDQYELGQILYLGGYCVNAELGRAVRLRAVEDDIMLYSLLLPKGQMLPKRFGLALQQLQSKQLWGRLRLVSVQFAEWLESVELCLRQNLTVRMLLKERAELVQVAWLALVSDEAIRHRWSQLFWQCKASLSVAASTGAVSLGIIFATSLPAAVETLDALRSRILRRFLHTRAKSFLAGVRQLAKTYKAGQAIRSVLKASLSKGAAKNKEVVVSFDAGCLGRLEAANLHAHLSNVISTNPEDLNVIGKLTKTNAKSLLQAYGVPAPSSSNKAADFIDAVIAAVKSCDGFAKPEKLAEFRSSKGKGPAGS